MRTQRALLVSLVMLLLGMAAWGCGPAATPTPRPTPPPPTLPPERGSIEACVRYNDQYTSNAAVSATDHAGRPFVAQANGCYYLHDLPPGDYLVKAEYGGASQSMDVTLHEGEWIHLDFWLEEPICPRDQVISCEEAKNCYGEFKTVQGLFHCVYRPDVKGQPTFCNCPVPHPNHDFTALIWGDERPAFESCLGEEPATLLHKQEFGVHGLIEEYRGKPEIILTRCDQLREKQ